MYNFIQNSRKTMSVENPIIYERKSSEEPALVIQLEDPHDLSHPKIQEMLEKLGITKRLFGQLLRRELEPISTAKFSLPPEGPTVEDIDQHIVDTPLGLVEVSDCKLYPPAAPSRDNTGLHLKISNKGGFEVIYALKGQAILTFPQIVEPIGGVYVASEKKNNVILTPGTLAIIPAPTANGWSAVGEGFEFRYICLPPWQESFVRPALDR
jgi:hypothetical protein